MPKRDSRGNVLSPSNPACACQGCKFDYCQCGETSHWPCAFKPANREDYDAMLARGEKPNVHQR